MTASTASSSSSHQKKIKNREKGITATNKHQTRIVEDPNQIIEEIGRLTANSNDLSTCISPGGLEFSYNYFFKIKKELLEKQKKGEHKGIRYVTNIQKDNIELVKTYLNSGIQIRHVKNLPPMSFGVSDKEMSATIEKMEGGKKIQSLLISTESSYIQHFASLFEDLWKEGVNAEDRIKEIEEGLEPIRTTILKSQEEIVEQIRNLNSRANHLSICSSLGGMQMSYNNLFDTYRNFRNNKKEEQNDEFNKLRWIINVDKDSLNLVKIFLDLGFQIRHVKNTLPLNFGVSDKEVALTIENMEGGKLSSSFLISNEPLYVNHFNSLFEEIWKNGIDAAERIKEIEAGVDLADIEVISRSSRAQETYEDIVKSASKEILWIFPTTNAFTRQDKMGAIPLAMQAAKERNVKVNILVPANKSVQEKIQQLKQNCTSCSIRVRYIEQMSETMATILIVDRKHSLVMELKDDSKTTFYDAIGLSTYSNSKAGVLSYVAIFENLWKQSELYEQLVNAHEKVKTHDRMQKEFIDVAAHELRTPIQPILGLTQMIYSSIDQDEYPYQKKQQQKELLEVVIRNAHRLQRLTEDILDVTKIESQNLSLKLEQINLDEIILNAINDAKRNQQTKQVSLLYQQQQHDKENTILIEADKGRLNQVISNLISNAVKFTKEGTIIITSKRDEEKENKVIVVSVKDSGIGIDPDILPRLFQKFATKSYQGTGLGLYISKSIVEAHGGKMWAENNSDGKGATFSFSLPLS
ncbi:MAG TPA: HAMP domain-containing sensor histidine kinase [Nitrososphaeraceae archaeon]|nr:HAMP domain-containing sensor histidine kinase [Nitrososphaeraceae archaeon]